MNAPPMSLTSACLRSSAQIVIAKKIPLVDSVEDGVVS
jgi:hypothetical protein